MTAPAAETTIPIPSPIPGPRRATAGPGEVAGLGRVEEFDGLRGYLAWWVVAFHLYQQTGLSAAGVAPLDRTLGQGWGGVPLFFILSGLVIAWADDARREPYGAFLLRRFFRLAPAYYLILAVAAVDAWRRGAYGRGGTFWSHVALHLTMLHGLVPDQILPGSPVALEYVAWSVSVEWQFYLLAPFVLRAVRTSPARATAVLAAFGLIGYALGKAPLSFDEGAPVFLRWGLFAAGIASYHALRFVTANPAACRPWVAYVLPALLSLVVVCGGPVVWPGPVWVVIFSAVLMSYAGVENPLTRPIRVALGLPLAVRLGRVSYSTYLCHDRVLRLADGLIARAMPAPSPWARGVALAAVGVPLIVVASAALHYLVERPGIRLGRRLASGARDG